MTVDEVSAAGARPDPASSARFALGPITAKIDPASGRVDLVWVDGPSLCLLEGNRHRTLELEPPSVPMPGPFPYPECAWPTEPMLGGACFTCAARGLEVCHGSTGVASVRVMPPGQPAPPGPLAASSTGRYPAADPGFRALLAAAPAVALATGRGCTKDCRGGQTELVVFDVVEVVKGPNVGTVAGVFVDQFVCRLFDDSPRVAVVALSSVDASSLSLDSIRPCQGSGPFGGPVGVPRGQTVEIDGRVHGFAEFASVAAARRFLDAGAGE